MTCRLCRVDCPDIRSVRVFRSYLALPIVILAGQRLYRQVSAGASGMACCCRVRWFRGRFRDHGRKPFLASIGGTAVAVTLSVTVRQVRDDGTEAPVDGELAAALSGPAEQFAGLLTWAADESGFLDHGEREDVIGQEGRELQRRLLQATFDLDSAREERIAHVTSAPGRPHGRGGAAKGRGPGGRLRPVAAPPQGAPHRPRAEPVSRRCPAGPAR